MVNLQEFIGSNSFARKFAVDELLFAEFKCPINEKSSVWWHNNFFAYVLAGETALRTPRQEYILKPGDSVFARKGSIITHNQLNEEFCEILIFVPDEFIRTIFKKYIMPLNPDPSTQASDTVIPLVSDEVLSNYFHSLLTHFVQPVPPSGTLLKLKFEELLLYILSSNNHQPLSYYFNEVCRSAKPSIRQIMEANFFSNLSLDEYARMCSRSLSAFKKEFAAIYHTTPGKWLQEKRLEYSRYLLQTTDQHIDEICMESGFENQSHFIRVFKSKYGLPPHKFRKKTSLV